MGAGGSAIYDRNTINELFASGMCKSAHSGARYDRSRRARVACPPPPEWGRQQRTCGSTGTSWRRHGPRGARRTHQSPLDMRRVIHLREFFQLRRLQLRVFADLRRHKLIVIRVVASRRLSVLVTAILVVIISIRVYKTRPEFAHGRVFCRPNCC